jgi:DNA-binding GntR family transcriptional regulator
MAQRKKHGGDPYPVHERHLSPALCALPPERLRVSSLGGIRGQIYNGLWQSIASGRMKSGAKLPESTLEQIYGVSRTLTRSVLEYLFAQGAVILPPNHICQVAKPAPEEAQAVFESLGVAMVHIVRALSSSARSLTPEHRRLLELHVKAQTEADEADDLLNAHLLGMEFLILLAALHGVTLLTDLVTRTALLLTLSLKLYGKFPPPAWHVAFQRHLIGHILAHRQEEAVAEFERRQEYLKDTLRLNNPAEYELDDLVALLGNKRSDAVAPPRERTAMTSSP